MNLVIPFPDEILVAIKEDDESFSKTALLYILGKLYEKGKISGGLGAKTLGCTKREFYQLISDNGFKVIDYSEKEFKKEIETSKELAKRLRK